MTILIAGVLVVLALAVAVYVIVTAKKSNANAYEHDVIENSRNSYDVSTKYHYEVKDKYGYSRKFRIYTNPEKCSFYIYRFSGKTHSYYKQYLKPGRDFNL